MNTFEFLSSFFFFIYSINDTSCKLSNKIFIKSGLKTKLLSRDHISLITDIKAIIIIKNSGDMKAKEKEKKIL
jgi:hypothetical protein